LAGHLIKLSDDARALIRVAYGINVPRAEIWEIAEMAKTTVPVARSLLRSALDELSRRLGTTREAAATLCEECADKSNFWTFFGFGVNNSAPDPSPWQENAIRALEDPDG